LAAIPGVTLWQDGDREKCFLFPADLFPAVAAVVEPRRRRKCHLTPEQMARLTELGRANLALLHGKATTQTRFGALESVPASGVVG
jgi:hypothetical protein